MGFVFGTSWPFSFIILYNRIWLTYTRYFSQKLFIYSSRKILLMFQYEGVIQKGSEGLVHHMEVFHCEVESNEIVRFYSGPGQAEGKPPELAACRKVIGAWAMGATVRIWHWFHEEIIMQFICKKQVEFPMIYDIKSKLISWCFDKQFQNAGVLNEQIYFPCFPLVFLHLGFKNGWKFWF